MKILETPRVMFRHYEPGDLGALYALYRDPEMRRYFPDGTLTLEETREELEFYLKEGRDELGPFHLYAIARQEHGIS